jgi:dienelactone hydrolase
MAVFVREDTAMHALLRDHRPLVPGPCAWVLQTSDGVINPRRRVGGSGLQGVVRSFLTVLLLTAALCAAGADPAREASPTRLRQMNAAVLSPAERASAVRALQADVEQRLREANARSSAEWQKVASRAEWEQFRTAKLAALRDSLGPAATPAPMRARVTGSLDGHGYGVQNLVFQSRPGLWVTANLYRPAPLRPSMPGLLICHAHHTPKEHGELQDMGVTWARAGCLVLVMDQLGHGERRQHPFRSAAEYSRPFQLSRQDYYFRYDLGIQLHLAGESLIGWMVCDLRRGVDLLLAQENVDPKRIILLGAVAGGGDPAAVTAALDDRITAAVPFNFGGPQPETSYPLPADAATSFDYAGSGSWESTRNLRRSAADGFLPWVIVGSLAPRGLVYAHEFSWDRERDPVWKRLQTIYELEPAPAHLAFTSGRGDVRGKPPEATHCTHIGPPHRRLIHAAFKEWFGIDVTEESSDRHPAEALRAMTPEAARELQPKNLNEALGELAAQRLTPARQHLSDLPLDQRRRQMQTDWARLLGHIEPASLTKLSSDGGRAISIRQIQSVEGVSVERIALPLQPVTVPMLLLRPRGVGVERLERLPVVVAVSQAGHQRWLQQRAEDVAALLDRGLAVCLPDVRGTGETSLGRDRGRRSEATALSSSELMLGGTMLGAQLRDLRAALAWLRTQPGLDAREISLWGDSLAQPNPADTNFQVPRDDDDALPRSPEPLGGLLALLAALYEDDVRAVYVSGGLIGFQSVLAQHLALIPHDAVVPGALLVGDMCDLVAALAPRRVRLEGLVDGWNRAVAEPELARAYAGAAAVYRAAGTATQLSVSPERTSAVRWLGAERAAPVSAVPAGLIPPDRLVSWIPGVTVGVPGGIPTSRAHRIDVTAPPYRADNTGATDASAAILAAIRAAASNEVVYLPAGRYRVDKPILGEPGDIGKGYYTVRGDGANTVIDWRGKYGSVFTLGRESYGKWDQPRAPTNALLGNLTKGGTNLSIAIMADSTWIGRLLELRQRNDADVISVGGYQNLQRQKVIVTGVSHGTNLTIWPPLHWTLKPGLSPTWGVETIWMARCAGIEDLVIDATNSWSGAAPVSLGPGYGCWIKNVRINHAANYAFGIANSLQCEMRGCVAWRSKHRTPGDWSNHAGLLMGGSTGCLIEDNILYQVFPHLEINAGSSGNVFAYNFLEDNNVANSLMGASIDANHGPHNHHNLYEGNVASKFQCDGYFGGASDDTLFRNWFHGTCPGQDQNGQCINLNRFSYRYSIVGNVLGTTNLAFRYDNGTNGFGYQERYIYSFGLPNMGNGGFNGRFGPPWSNPGPSPGPSGFQELDTNVVSTVILKGNFNYATTNVPASEALRGESLPHSLYLTTKPGWWNAPRWPAFGSDMKPPISPIPAQVRWATMQP